MLTILHGENVVASRNELVKLLSEAAEKGREVERLDAKSLSLGELEEKLVSQDLFGTERIVVIEGLHSLPRSKQKTQLIELVASANISLILWEKRDLTKTMLKKFPEAEVKNFKLSKALFAWLDTFSGSPSMAKKQVKAFHQALEQEDPYLCLIMLARQIRMLIEAAETGQVSGPPWMAKKLVSQAKSFTLDQLLDIHSRLLTIDHKHKVSGNTLELSQELDLLLLSL